MNRSPIIKVLPIFFGWALLTPFFLPRFTEATPGNRFPFYLSHTVVLRLTGCMNQWLQDEINYIFRDLAGTGDDLCPPGQYVGPGTSTTYVSCGFKTRNFINALLMDLLDQDDNSRVVCCCDPAQDTTNCTGAPIAPCTGSPFPATGICMNLEPQSTNYLVAAGFQAWATAVTSMPGNTTVYWKGLLDQCLPIPLMGTTCLNISLNDVCNGATCGPVLNYNGSTNPGNCAYPPYTANLDANPCDDGIYQSANTDRFILFYDVVNGVSVNFTVGESPGIQCGMGPLNYSYNGKTFTGNEGFLTIDLQLGAVGNPLRIDIDAATPSPGNRRDFGNFQLAPNRATNVAPGKGDCDPNTGLYQGNCYVRAYLQAAGALKLAIGATLYLEHRTDNWPHMQDVGLAIRSIDFSTPPWISLQLDWRWTEQSPNCTNANTCLRRDATVKAAKLIEFADLVLRGLFRYDWIPSGLQQFFGPVVFDITELTQQTLDYIAPTWVRPKQTDTLFLDISMGGEPVLGTNVLRSKSCFANTGVGPTGNRNELYLIAHGMIDTDLFRRGQGTNFDHILPSCGYQGSPTHSAFTPAAFPTQFPHLPHAGNTDSFAATCNGDATFIGLSFHQNVFSHLVSDIASSGVMCIALHKDGEGLASGLPLPIFTVGQVRLLIPDLYNFLQSEYGSGVTDIPLIFVLKPKLGAAVPGFPGVPQATLVDDTTSWNPLPITGDVLLTLPNNDIEIWVDVDNVVEQWGYGPGDDPVGTCSYGYNAATMDCYVAGFDFNTGTTPPGLGQIARPPAGNTNDFINNFPDCVSFVDCDGTIGNPSDRTNERRFIAQFNVGVTLGLDLNLYGCGRLSGKVFGNLPAWGFSSTWYNPWNPSTAGNCTTVSHLRRADLTVGFVSRVGAVSVFNDATVVRSYYPFSGGTFNAFLADAIAVLLSSQLALDAQLGYTLSPIIDPGDDLYSAVPANNRVLRIGGHTAGNTATTLTATYITRDDVGNTNPDPAPAFQQSFLTVAIDLQGIIHPNFIYDTISTLLGGSTDLFAPPIFGAMVDNANKLQILLSKFDELKRKVDSGQEVSFKIGMDEIKKIVRSAEEAGYVVPKNGRSQNLVEDFPPEVIVDWVDARTERTVIKLSCVDDRTATSNCWYSWRWAGEGRRGIWRQWQQSDEIEIRGLPDGIYAVEVRALDEMAIPDITPTVVKFVIDDNAPSAFFPKQDYFKKGEFINVELWDYITPPDKIKVSWKIGEDQQWSDWTDPDYIENGLGKKFIRVPYKEGSYTLYLKTRDQKGNEETYSFPFSVGKKSGVFGCGK
ncbi:MAG: hypothetical protein N2254_00165 [bacterium]|nr:hypothetical protein [bacterium]